MARKPHVLLVASEATPFAKTGGMADVCDAIPTYLAQAGCDVDVLLPYYRDAKSLGLDVEPLVPSFAVDLNGRAVEGSIVTAKVDRPWRPLLVKQDDYYDRDGLYTDPETGRDHPDNAERFAFFGHAALAAIAGLKKKYDVVHCHEWQGALALLYLRLQAADNELFAAPATVFTIHNMGYQGLFDASQGAALGLPPEWFAPEQLEFYGKWNLVKGALLHADFISTVSEKYAAEIQTDELGFGLAGVLRSRADRLVGITHGVDYSIWDPEHDRCLAATFGPGKLAGKARCKKDLLGAFGSGQAGCRLRRAAGRTEGPRPDHARRRRPAGVGLHPHLSRRGRQVL
jgi:starch synthase